MVIFPPFEVMCAWEKREKPRCCCLPTLVSVRKCSELVENKFFLLFSNCQVNLSFETFEIIPRKKFPTLSLNDL